LAEDRCYGETMLRVLTLSTLFPNSAQPTLGVFVERQTLELAALDGVELEVVAPVGLPPWPLSRHPHYAPRARLPKREEWKGLPAHRPRYRVLPKIGRGLDARSIARALLPVLRRIRQRFPFDVIDTQFFWPDGPAAMHLSAALGVPFSIKARGADIQYWAFRSGIGRQILAAGRAADGLLAVSQALKQVMVARGMPADKIRVHYTGVDRDQFRPVDRARAKAALHIEGPLIVSAGALIPRKGYSLTIGAMTDLPEATLLIVGDGPQRNCLQRLAAKHGVADRVRFLGNRPQEEVAGLLAAADVMVLPSTSEGLANVWLEALASGTPIVISDVGGAREVLDRPEGGRIVHFHSGEIASAVRDILARPPDPAAVRATAERFSWEKNALELRDHLAGVARRS
jgi:glycosyltransferase involved in cell wall biosynthesis